MLSSGESMSFGWNRGCDSISSYEFNVEQKKLRSMIDTLGQPIIFAHKFFWRHALPHKHCSEHIASANFNVVYFFIKALVPCCCLHCPSADTYDSSGYLVCHIYASTDSPSADTYDSSDSSGCLLLLCRVSPCDATMRIFLMLVATIEVRSGSLYLLKGIHKS